MRRRGEPEALGCLKEPRVGVGDQILYLALRVARPGRAVNRLPKFNFSCICVFGGTSRR